MHKIMNINTHQFVSDLKSELSGLYLLRTKTIWDKRNPNIGSYAEAPIDDTVPTRANHFGL
jgi:hypothetical protein